MPNTREKLLEILWIIKDLFQWVWEYLTLTPNKYRAVVSKLEVLLWYATGGQYSKAGYTLIDMENMVNDYIEQCCEEAVKEALAERENRQ